MALPDESKNSASIPPAALSNLSDGQLLDNFKQNPTAVASDLIRQPNQLNRFWTLLERHSSQDQALIKAYDKAQNILGKVPPVPQSQPTAVPIPGAPPTVTAEQIIQPEAETVKKNNIGPQNAKPLEKFLNDFRPRFDAYMAEKKIDAATSSHEFTQNLMAMLAMYRGDLAHFYLSEGAMEMFFSSLGPIGDLWRAGYEKNYRLKMKWMMNPLNPNSVYYYLNSLPAKQAFKILYLPAKATWAILTHGGAPFTARATYMERKYDPEKGPYQVVKQGNFFSPKLKMSQVADVLADGLGTFIGPSPSHDDFADVLDVLKTAKLSGDKKAIKNAKNNVRLLLDRHNSFSGLANFPKAILRKGLINSYRRLKRHERDPISYILSLLGGSFFDLIMTATLRPLAVIANKLINLIPGVNILRTQLAEFLSSNRVLTTARIGGTSISSFVRGVLSPTTFSFGYVGYNLVPGSPLAQAILTPTFAGIGAFYKTAVNLANLGIYDRYGELNPVGWVRRYDALVAQRDLQTLEKGYLKGFKPGPVTRFADFLHHNWLVRIPINGWVAADFLSPLMQRLYGWNSVTTHAVFTAVDYFWQIKGPLFRTIGDFISQIPAVQRLVASIQFGITFPLQNWWFNMVYKATSFQQSLVGAIPTQWKMRTWANFAQNFFNPGFFMGFGLIPLLTPAMGGWAYLAGPVAGSLTWNAAAFALEKTFGVRIASMVKINAWGWTGYIVGSVLQLIFPALPAWFGMATALAFPAIGMLFSAFGISFGSILGWIGSLSPVMGEFLAAIASGIGPTAIAIWGTIMAIGSVTLLTVFFAYTIYAGFWVPMIEEGKAQPQSSNFSISSACTLTAPNQYQCCSNFSVTENVFNSRNFLDHNTDFIRSDLTVNLNSPASTTHAFRGKELIYTTYVTEWTNGDNYSLVIPPGNMIDDAHPYLDAFLPTPFDQPQNLFELMQTNSSVVFSMQPFFDILTQLAKEFKPCTPNPRAPCSQDGQLVAEYKTQVILMEHKKSLLEKLISQLKLAVNSNNLVFSLTQIKADLATAATPANNPLTDPCPDAAAPCAPEQQGLKDLFNSWPALVQQYSYSIGNFLIQAQSPTADPIVIKASLQAYLDTLTDLPDQIDSQITNLNAIIDQIEKAQGKMDAADAQAIINTNFSGFANMAPDGPEQLAAWALLEKYFPGIFKKSHTFYFIPQGTNYQVCLDMDYSGPTGVEQTVCSTISYTPSVWGPNTSFARSCTTFTPE